MVAVRVEQLEEVNGLAVINRRAMLAFVIEVGLGIVSHVIAEGVLAVVAFDEETGEVGGEAFAQPEVGPGGFGDGIAEPLMRDFMRDC